MAKIKNKISQPYVASLYDPLNGTILLTIMDENVNITMEFLPEEAKKFSRILQNKKGVKPAVFEKPISACFTKSLTKKLIQEIEDRVATIN